MSTELGKIKGKKELSIREEVEYQDVEMYITSFYGGTKRKTCIQLTNNISGEHIQLRKSQVEKLVKKLNKWLQQN